MYLLTRGQGGLKISNPHTEIVLSETQVDNIQSKLVEWYEQNQRDLPWRRARDPYHVWTSEIMLQQTRVDTAIPYYEKFIGLFPTLESLAAAPEEHVLKAWEGLGYYSRARNFHHAVREVVAHYGGVIPNNENEFRKLPGVGPYTVGAVLSIAYGQPIPAVDGNVLRVCSRLFGIMESVDSAKVKKLVGRLIQQLIPAGQASAFNQGIMELGALVCMPGSPRCERCPLLQECLAYRQNQQHKLPVKNKAKAIPTVLFATGIMRRGNRYLIMRRPATGLLANLWEFPTIQYENPHPQEKLQNYLADHFRTFADTLTVYMEIKHIFSHVQWALCAYRGEITSGNPVEDEQVRWVTLEEMQEYPFAGPHRKLRGALGKGT